MPFLSTFHTLTKKLSIIPADDREWPEEWRKTVYKVYNGAPVIPLPPCNPEHIPYNVTLQDTLTKRSTKRDFNKDTPLTQSELSALLALSCGETGEMIAGTEGQIRRVYASAGALYPLEVYLVLTKSIESISPGLYHYRADTHALETLDTAITEKHLEGVFVYDWVYNAPVTIFLTGVFSRCMNKYGMRGYRFIHIEAGEVLANLGLVAHMLDMSSAHIGGTDDTRIESLLDIDGVTEAFLCASVFGKVKRNS